MPTLENKINDLLDQHTPVNILKQMANVLMNKDIHETRNVGIAINNLAYDLNDILSKSDSTYTNDEIKRNQYYMEEYSLGTDDV